jgi:zinc/manganese transport system permease protein
MLYARTIGKRLAIGWVMGILVSILGMYFSVLFDLPTGATIVCTFGLTLVVIAAARPLVQRTFSGVRLQPEDRLRHSSG